MAFSERNANEATLLVAKKRLQKNGKLCDSLLQLPACCGSRLGALLNTVLEAKSFPGTSQAKQCEPRPKSYLGDLQLSNRFPVMKTTVCQNHGSEGSSTNDTLKTSRDAIWLWVKNGNYLKKRFGKSVKGKIDPATCDTHFFRIRFDPSPYRPHPSNARSNPSPAPQNHWDVAQGPALFGTSTSHGSHGSLWS